MQGYANNSLTGLEIAVVGLSGRFPGAKNIGEFWDNIKNGVEGVSFFSDREMEEADVAPQLLGNSNYIKARAILDDIESFDSFFFGYTPVESELMDPQTRIFHECAWEALEDAGYAPGTFQGRIGLYAGASTHLPWEVMSLMSGKTEVLGSFTSWLFYDKDFLSTRVSYSLDLSGPAINLQTACSTSLVAVHTACQGLLSGECHMALAGGITVSVSHKSGYLYQPGMVASSDGHCRTFDAGASGTIWGEGVGLVLLKPLENAVADRDHIYAVIKSSAVNNDGKAKVGYTAPSVRQQAAAIRKALRAGRVVAESIGYIEAHGTATELGDPAEIEALKQAFNTDKKGFCRIGSVKSNIGHTDVAAGIAGFIKTVLALKHRQIPPSLHFETPNPKIDFKNSPFSVNTRLTPWENNGYPLRAGVSSFGVGGTNAHVILEEAPRGPGEVTVELRSGKEDVEYRLIPLSAKTEAALERNTRGLIAYLEANPGTDLADVSYTLALGRKAFNHRKIVVASGTGEALRYLSDPHGGKVHEFTLKKNNPPVVFMFSGQGSQYAGMGLELYQKEDLFRREMDRCFDILTAIPGHDLREILYPGLYPPSAASASPPGDTEPIYRQDVVQPLMFVLEYALARLLMHRGIQPYAMIGYSIGEYVAACLSGVFSLEDALRIVALRGKAMQEIPGGKMISVPLPEEELLPLIEDNENISVAVVNGPSCIVSGPGEEIDAFEKQLKKEKRCLCMPLSISHAGHSKMMDPMLEKFREGLKQVTFKVPEIPYISTLTGHWIRKEEAVDPVYWTRHLRETVRFAGGLTELLKEEHALFVELGPGRVLSTVALQHPGKKKSQQVLNLLKHPDQEVSDRGYLLSRLCLLWLYGTQIDWATFYEGEKRNRIPLPTYSFDRYRYPVNGSVLGKFLRGEGVSPGDPSAGDAAPQGKKADIADWFYLPSWKPSVLPFRQTAAGEEGAGAWLVFSDDHGAGERLVRQLKARYPDIVIVKRGSRFAEEADSLYSIHPGESSHYEKLMDALRTKGKKVGDIVHMWNMTSGEGPGSGADDVEQMETCLDSGYYSLIYLARAIGDPGTRHEIRVTVLSSSMQAVPGSKLLYPEKATLLGPVQIIPREYPNIRCRCVDVDLPAPGTGEESRLISRLMEELTAGPTSPDTVVAYRGNQRLIRAFEPFRLEKTGVLPRRLKEKGVYLVTGGLGGVGLELARYLAVNFRARLVLTGRSVFPPTEEWDRRLEQYGENDPVNRKIRELRAMEENGAEVMVAGADVSDFSQMESVFRRAVERFGGIDGILHCALHLDGALIHRVTREITDRVFATKLKGTLILKQLAGEYRPAFLLLFSSLSAVLGTPGEVVYCASNAFLDAFASHMHTEEDLFTVSVNWDTWQEVGGAVETMKRMVGPLTSSKPRSRGVDHPLLQARILSPGEQDHTEYVYVSTLNSSKHWPLDEHRIGGNATLPGTAYLEMAGAAFKDLVGSGAVEMRNIYLTTPLIVRDDEEKEVQTILGNGKKEGEFEFRIVSRSGTGEWQEHARGTIAAAANESPPRHDISEFETLCPREEQQALRGTPGSSGHSEALVTFGSRWSNNIKKNRTGENSRFTELELDPAFLSDMDVYTLHPALLDCAFAFPRNIGFFLPFSYKRLKIHGTLPPRIFSYMTYSVVGGSPGTGGRTLNCGITIVDEQGIERMRVEEYTLLEVSGKNPGAFPADAAASSSVTGGAAEDELVKAQLRHGMLPAEGVDVFERVVDVTVPRVVVSTRALDGRMRAVASSGSSGSADTSMMLEEAARRGPTHPRPDLSTRYTAPSGETEKKLAEIWQKLLGIDRVGTHDNFFDLGATSLTVMHINRLLKDTLGKDVAVVTMYIYPTVAELARFLDREGPAETFSAGPGSSRQNKGAGKEKLKQRKSKVKNRLPHGVG